MLIVSILQAVLMSPFRASPVHQAEGLWDHKGNLVLLGIRDPR